MPDEVLAKCDVCHGRPCRNGGACVAGRGRTFSCRCSLGFYGDTCEQTINACYGNPCANGGTCKIVQEGRYRSVMPSAGPDRKAGTGTLSVELPHGLADEV